MNRLSDTEVEEIRAACLDGWTDPAIAVTIARAITPAVEAIVAARLASVEALGQDGSPGSLMEAVRAELTTYLGQGSANLATSRVMHQIRTHLAAVLGSDAHTEQKGTGR